MSLDFKELDEDELVDIEAGGYDCVGILFIEYLKTKLTDLIG